MGQFHVQPAGSRLSSANTQLQPKSPCLLLSHLHLHRLVLFSRRVTAGLLRERPWSRRETPPGLRERAPCRTGLTQGSSDFPPRDRCSLQEEELPILSLGVLSDGNPAETSSTGSPPPVCPPPGRGPLRREVSSGQRSVCSLCPPPLTSCLCVPSGNYALRPSGRVGGDRETRARERALTLVASARCRLEGKYRAPVSARGPSSPVCTWAAVGPLLRGAASVWIR